MNPKASVRVGEFFVDSANQCLWRNEAPVDLLPQAWAVFRVLLERPGQVVTKKQLLALAWQGLEVSDAALSQTIRRLRSALDDDARRPRYIETVHRRGFRLIAPLSMGATPSTLVSRAPEETEPFVGRDDESELLADALQRAREGTRQIVFVEGDAGIGKTALIEAFRRQTHNHGVRVATSQCVQQHGIIEPYMPVLEALDRSVRADPSILGILRRYAPSWLSQMPWFLDPGEAQRVERQATDATQGRMLREMALALEVMSADRPLLLVLEDLHWADQSTIDLLSLLAARPDPAQLMIVGTYRPVEAIAFDHPIPRLARTLAATRTCTRLSLDALGAEDVGRYLAERFALTDVPAALAVKVHSRCEGNPLFLVAVADHLVDRGLIATEDGRWYLTRSLHADDLRDIPTNLREMITQQLAAIEPAEIEVLQAASVAAIEFRSASVAAALALEGPEGIEQVESVCDRLAASDHLLSATGEQVWPDGTRTATYAFRHQLYRQSLYENLGSSYRRRYHQRVGERLERGFAAELRRVVAELAAHFDQSGDDEKALAYFTLAARQAHQRFAHREAVELLQLALPHLQKMPAGRDRDIDELQLRSGIVLALWLGELHRPEEERLQMARIRELSSALAPGEDSLRLSFRLWTLYSTRSLPNLANSFADRMLEATDFASELRVEALIAKGMTVLMRGEFDDGLDHLRRALESNGDPPGPDDLERSRSDWKRTALPIHAYMMLALAFVGAFRRSLEHLRTALAISAEEEVPPKHAAATQLGAAAVLCYVLGDLGAGRACSERGLALAEEHDLGYLAVVARLQLTWLDIRSGARRDSADRIAGAWREYLDARGATPTPLAPIFLADACRESGLVENGLTIVDTVWQDTRDSGLRWYDAELQRLKGDLLSISGGRSARQRALECYRQALGIAREQGCRFYELRAAVSLGKLDNVSRTSRAAIRRAYAGVEAEVDTPDLIAATELIDC